MQIAYFVLVSLFLTCTAWEARASEHLVSCSDRIVVVPPPVDDALFSAALADSIRNVLSLRYSLKCTKKVYLENQSARELMDSLGSTVFFPRSVRSLDEKQVEILRDDWAISVVVEADWQPSSRRLTMRVYRLTSRYRIVKIATLVDKLSPEDVAKLPRAYSLVSWLAKLTPNAFTLGFTRTEAYGFKGAYTKQNYKEGSTRVYSSIPTLLSSISFNKIDHHDAFNTWDVAGSIFPGSYFFGIDQMTDFYNNDTLDPADTRIVRLKIYGTCTNLNALGTVHTLIGAFYAGLGAGPCLYWRRQDDGQPIWAIDGAMRLLFGYRIFTRNNTFFFFEGDSLSFNQPLYKSEFVRTKSIGRSMLGMGWFVPDIETKYTSHVTGVVGSPSPPAFEADSP